MIILKHSVWANFVKHKFRHCINFNYRYINSSEEVRNAFINFYKKHNHTVVPSSKVYSNANDSLLFVNAGMNQFKPIFLGISSSTIPSAVNTQRCIRVRGKHNDLDVVGQDCHHHTFFEMLGSWSFGDYFKREACQMAWELLTKVYCLPVERLYVTYFGGSKEWNIEPDLETRDVWLSVGVPKDKIFAFGAKYNFWEMGEVGPCGPSTEIHYDQIGNRYAPGGVNIDGSNVIEIWNLVFMQYNRLTPNHLELLDQFHVDTGMGLERITAILQGTLSNYDTDLFQPIIAKLTEMGACQKYCGKVGKEDKNGIDSAYRIISDHIRMITVAISDGIFPGPRERDLIVRHVLRRAAKAGVETLELPKMFLGELVPLVVDKLKSAFPELVQNQSNVIATVSKAEETFYSLIEKGDHLVEETVSGMNPKERLFPSKTAIHLLSYVGYPKDRLLKLLQKHDKTVDLQQIDQFFNDKRSDGLRQNNNTKCLTATLLSSMATSKLSKTNYVISRYLKKQKKIVFEPIKTKVLAVFDVEGRPVQSCNAVGNNVYVLLEDTCFAHPDRRDLPCVGELRFRNEIFKIEDIITIQNWILHRVSSNSNDLFQLLAGSSVEILVDSNKWLPFLCAFSVGNVAGEILQTVAGKSNIQKIKYEPDKVIIEVSGSLTDGDVIAFENTVNKYISRDEVISNEKFNTVLHSKDLKSFLISKCKRQGSSRTFLHCITGSRATGSLKSFDKLMTRARFFLDQDKTMLDEDKSVDTLLADVGKLMHEFHRSEISFAAKASYKKELKLFFANLQALKSAESNAKTD